MADVFQADLQNRQHQIAIINLLDQYAEDEMGQGSRLRPSARRNLLNGLLRRPWIHVFLAQQQSEFVGILVGVEGFSTFNAAPLLNVHDVYVRPEFRRQGIAHRLFSYAEAKANDLGCCKLTLEVLEGNHLAQSIYRAMGFTPYSINDHAGVAQFWQKYL
ncbi:MAG: GNAT family N-acetyltransferase [Acidithiobacillus sp.]